MSTKTWRTWWVTFVRLALVTSILLFSGCQTVTPAKAEISFSGTGQLSQAPNLENEKKEISPAPEVAQAPIPMQDTEPISEQKVEPIPPTPPAPSVTVDESDKDPAPTPAPGLPGTPIHPYYDLSGTPPSAPGLAMRVREFDVEPEKIAYLTFDDGPHPDTTPRILKILKDQGVKATFFVVGRQVEMHPDLLKAEYEQGEGIGNHSYSHDYRLLYRSPEAFLAEIKQMDELIFKTIGARSQVVRAPGGTQGHFHVNYFNTVDAADYLIYDWNVSIGDADAPLVPADKLIRNVKAQVPGKSRIIILMHDAGAKLTTVDALPQIIQFLKDQGYSFGVITPKVAPVLFPGGFHS